MPSTITQYYTFAPATKARASQVNTNFANYRGDMLPINEDTITASNHTHNVGAPDHYWNTGYYDQVDLRTSTSTASLIIKGDVTNTTGAFLFQIEGVTKASIDTNGFDLSYGSTASKFRIRSISFTATGATLWTVPSYVPNIFVVMCGAGGGGGGGGCIPGAGIGAGGGGGGEGGRIVVSAISVTPGDVLTITVGTAGAAGFGTTLGAGSAGGAGGNTTFSTLLTALGGQGGGLGGNAGTAGAGGYVENLNLFGLLMNGGAGAGASGSGTAGRNSIYASAGAGGNPGSSNSSAGGGGGASLGNGGLGGHGWSTGVAAIANSGGGGGGGGSGDTGFLFGARGGDGGSGLVRIYFVDNTA